MRKTRRPIRYLNETLDHVSMIKIGNDVNKVFVAVLAQPQQRL